MYALKSPSYSGDYAEHERSLPGSGLEVGHRRVEQYEACVVHGADRRQSGVDLRVVFRKDRRDRIRVGTGTTGIRSVSGLAIRSS